ncbi:MAG: DUF3465 domain-containing protein [Leptolyngbyaceae cyanobacterium CRU_2_3]|nr:DUF3465 domain-containing protein [Leptolyngbyaceae cyanobacterium CRU_2_3]
MALIATLSCQQQLSLPSLASSTLSAGLTESSNALKGASPKYPLTNLAILENAFRNRVSNLQVLVSGRVISLLSDDTQGDRHQRFIVKLPNSQTLLVSHNIDIAPRVNRLRVGDQLYIYGEYEWNSRGGVIHWTHRDPNRRHINGWISRNGKVFR